MTNSLFNCPARRKAVWGPKRLPVLLTLSLLGVVLTGDGRQPVQPTRESAPTGGTEGPSPGAPNSQVTDYRIDRDLDRITQKGNPDSRTRVIVTLLPGAQLPPVLKQYVRANGRLAIINGEVLDLPNRVIRRIEAYPEVFRVHYDRPIAKLNYRTAVTVGVPAVRDQYGYTGAGVGVAVLDSGIASWHNDLTRGSAGGYYPYGDQRVSKFVDFVGNQTHPTTTTVTGRTSRASSPVTATSRMEARRAVAPDAKLVSLKVLDQDGAGSISNVIAALDWVVANARTYNIRVVNLSVGAPIRESYLTDPLTLAAKAVVDRGITVVTAAGNLGMNAKGRVQYGSITAPGNAPWVLTVGASSTEGTTTRGDDKMASFSSVGPTYIDFGAKPDLVAPGTGTVSLAVPNSTFYTTKQGALSKGDRRSGEMPYLSLSGTSMAAPVVTGTVALMLQANPGLTPNLIKAILQYTAEQYSGYSPLRQGTGFLNALGAVRLARFYANNSTGVRMPTQASWSKQIIWGNHLLRGGYLNPLGNAWATNVVWGTVATRRGEQIVWGTDCGNSCDKIVWSSRDASGDNIVWGTRGDDNVVWGTSDSDNIVWGTAHGDDNVVWGTRGDDNVVWGTDCGGSDCDNVVWGTVDQDNVVWGTLDNGDDVLWGSNYGNDNVVWGTSGDDNVVWGSRGDDDTIFPDADPSEPLPDPAVEFGDFETQGGL